MIRQARPEDAGELCRLNREFNGECHVSEESVAASLLGGGELAVVAEVGGELAGFVCAQIRRSFCYREASAEITEVYVNERFRRRGLAREMILFIETLIKERGADEISLLTGRDNMAAQALYKSLGYAESGEFHFVRT